MTEMHPALRKEFEAFVEESIKLSPEFQLLKDDNTEEPEDSPNYTSFESKIEELVFQGFLFGLLQRNKHEVIFEATCIHCNNSITEDSEGEIVWKHDIAKEEGWVWNFDDQNWSCPDCAPQKEIDDNQSRD